MRKDNGQIITDKMTSRGERTSYMLYFMGQNFFYMLVSSFLATYLLMQNITAAMTAGVLLIVKVWDAVNDPLFGSIVDRVKFRSGAKFMPWIRISLFFIPAATVLMFAIPTGMALAGKLIWLTVAYILWDTAYTICDVPAFGLVTTMTSNVKERTALMAYSRITATIGSILVMLGVPVLIGESVGLSFTAIAIVLAVVSTTLMLPLALVGKERASAGLITNKPYSIKDMLRYLASNKYLFIYYAGLFVFYALNTMQNVYLFASYYLFNSTLVATAIGATMAIPAIAVGLFVPKIIHKVDKFRFFFWCNVACAVIGAVTWAAGYASLGLHLALMLLRGIAFGGVMVTMYMFTPDCSEYGQYKTGIDAKGITFAIQTFSTKLMMAVSTSLSMLVLGWFGWRSVQAENFAELAASGITQSAQALQGLWITYALIPAIGALLAIPIWARYKLRDSDVQLMALYNSGKLTRDECDAKLSRKY